MSTQQIVMTATPEQTDILLAELGEIGFSIFEDLEGGLIGYCETDVFDLSSFKEIIERYALMGEIKYQINQIEKQNWNDLWESNYEPIRILDLVFIRASFHDSEPGYAIEIVIDPKMSFGTGHHETTYLMSEAIFALPIQQMEVLDAGTGTGILALITKKLGANFVRGFDIDAWSVENSIENAALNLCESVEFSLGTILDEGFKPYDLLLANINRNILMAEMSEYALRIKPEGYLLLSGYYEEDIPLIRKSAEGVGMKWMDQKIKNRWACLCFQKGKV